MATPGSARSSSSSSSVWSRSTAPTTCSSSSSTALPLGLSIAVGFIATAILVVNNVRDLETDRRAGKMTLAVRMGRHNAVVLYRGLVLGAFVVLPLALLAGGGSWLPLIGLLALPMAFKPMRAMTNRTDGPALNGALAGTGALLGVFSLLVSVGLLLAS